MLPSTTKSFTFLPIVLVYLLTSCGTTEQLVKPEMSAKPLMGAIPMQELDCSGTGIYQELKPPPELKAKGVISTQLSARPVNKCVNGKSYLLQSYIDDNAGSDVRAVGPTYNLEVLAGFPDNALIIEFTNLLGDKNRQYDCHSSQDLGLCTNLHVHGLHVSPKGSTDPAQIQSDFVFLAISPRNANSSI